MGGGDRLHRPDVDELALAGARRVDHRGLARRSPPSAPCTYGRPRPAALQRLAVGLAGDVEVAARRPVDERAVCATPRTARSARTR